jgi:hypothetical protein
MDFRFNLEIAGDVAACGGCSAYVPSWFYLLAARCTTRAIVMEK